MGGGGHKDHQSFTVTPSHVGTATLNQTGPNSPDINSNPTDVDIDDLVYLEPGLAAVPPAEPAGATPDAAGTSGTVAGPVPAPEPGPDIEEGGEASPDSGIAVETDGNVGPGAPVTDDGEPDVDVLTPVPEDLPAGDVAGVALLVGGADLVDSTATLIAYDAPSGPREVLVATVDEAAEAKLLEALGLSETKMVPVQVETEVNGRLPIDTDKQLFERLAKTAKSINHHLKAGTEVPAHTEANLAALGAELAGLAGTDLAEGDQAMLAHYQAAAAAIEQRAAPGYAVAYGQGGKIPIVTAYETTGTAMIIQYVPAPTEALAPGQLPTAIRDATRLAPTLSKDGTASWDGHARRPAAQGKEYVVDLGGGYSAVYRPYGANDPAKSEYSMRGTLEVIAPAGAGHGPELVDRLGQVNLVNRPMTATEGEWAYLCRNVTAQGFANHPAVKAALADADGLEDAVEHVIFAERAHEAIGMDDTGLHRFAKQIRLDAEAKALPDKVNFLRAGVASAAGYPDGAALTATPGYQPIPRRGRAGLAWERFDVTGSKHGLRQAFANRGLTHRVTGGNVADLFRTGMLASTERRALMGVTAGKGMSEGADKLSGGASSVFLRVGNKPSSGPVLYWDDPTVVLARADWYAYPSDHFGSVNPKSHHSTTGQTRDPHKVATFAGNNEIMVRHGLDLLGAEAPSLVRCSSPAQRSEVLAVLAAKNITHLGGRPIADVVK